MECKHVNIPLLHKPNRFIYYLSDVNVLSKYPNTLRKFYKLRVRGVVYWNCTTHHRPMFSEPRASILVIYCQTGIGATGVFIVTSAQRSRNGTMKHDAMLHYTSFDVKLPKFIYSDYVISVFSYIVRFSLFL